MSSPRYHTPPAQIPLPQTPPPASTSQASSHRPAATKSGTVDLNLFIAESEARFKEMDALLAPFPVIVPKRTPRAIANRPLDPDGPMDTDNAIILQHMFDHYGFVGLARAARDMAGQYMGMPDVKPSVNYSIISDKAKEDKFINILMTMHYDVIRHILRGDLAWEYCHNQKLRAAVNTHHALRKVPGTYIQALGRSETELKVPDTRKTEATLDPYRVPNPNAGGWLTAREIWKVYHIALEYLPTPNSNLALAKAVDEVHLPWAPQNLVWYGGGNRRYIKSEHADKFKKWLSVWKETYIARIKPLMDAETKPGDNTLLDTPFRSCPFEVGYGIDVRQRANAHDAHQSSNVLWTFFLAIVNYAIDPQQDIFTIYRFQTNSIASVDDILEHALIADVGITLIARSEWHQGGFNPAPGGGAGVNRNILEKNKDRVLKSFDETYQENSIITSNITKQDAITEKLNDFMKKVKEQPETKKRLEANRKELLEKVEAGRKRLQRIKDAVMIMELEKVVEKYEEERFQARQAARALASPELGDTSQPAGGDDGDMYD